jgi:uncharacterized protein YoxC
VSISEALSIATSIVSMALAFFSIWLSFHFYEKTKETEKQVSNSLAKIEAQTAALQKINAKWMDRLTQYVTTDSPRPVDETTRVLLQVLTELPQSLSSGISQPTSTDSKEQLIEEIYTLYIIVYYYSALTNYWAQVSLPDFEDFDSTDDLHQLIMRVIDGSCNDFQFFAQLLGKADQERLNKNGASAVLNETKDIWRHEVKNTSAAFISRSTREQNT